MSRLSTVVARTVSHLGEVNEGLIIEDEEMDNFMNLMKFKQIETTQL